MSNNIGELFKIFCSNEIFTKYLQNINTDTNQNELLDTIMNDEEFISLATQFVEDKEVIKNKVQIKIGQEMKKNNKSNVKPEPEIINENKENNNEIFIEDWNDPYQLRYISEDTTMQLQKDNSIKLVTSNFTLYY